VKQKYYVIAQELKRRLAREVPLVELRVFGSCARGDESPDSDIDIFIEVETLSRENKKKVRKISWETGLENASVISSLVFSRDEIERSPLGASPIVESIKHEGIEV